MKISITHRLFLAIILAAGMAVISMVIIMQWSMRLGFLRYLDTMEKTGFSRLAGSLEEGYCPESGWDFVVNDPTLWDELVMTAIPEGGPPLPPQSRSGPRPDGPPPNPGMEKGEPPGPPPSLAQHFDQRLFLLDADRKVVISQVEVPEDSKASTLLHQ